MRAALLLMALVATAGAVMAGAGQSQRQPAPPSAQPARPARTPEPPRLDRAVLNRQDRSSRAERRREADAFDQRPLLTQLPLELAGVTLDVAGLAGDGRTLISIDPGPRSRAFAHAVYRQALATYGDSGAAYRLTWTP